MSQLIMMTTGGKDMKKILVCVTMLCGLMPVLSYAATDKLNLITAWCDGSTAYSAWDIPNTGGMVKTCAPPGTTGVRYGVLAVPNATTNIVAFTHFRWPSDFVSTPVTVVVEYTGSVPGLAGNVRTAVQIVCLDDTGVNGNSLQDPTILWNSWTALTPAVPVNAGTKKTVTLNNVGVVNCESGEHAFLKLIRVANDPGDTYNGAVNYLNVEVSYTRTGP
jgi:hypothetical protein